MTNVILTVVVGFILSTVLFKFAVALFSPENHLNTFARAVVVGLVSSVVGAGASQLLGSFGPLAALVINVVVMMKAYQLVWWRALLIMFFNGLLLVFAAGFLGSVIRL